MSQHTFSAFCDSWHKWISAWQILIVFCHDSHHWGCYTTARWLSWFTLDCVNFWLTFHLVIFDNSRLVLAWLYSFSRAVFSPIKDFLAPAVPIYSGRWGMKDPFTLGVQKAGCKWKVTWYPNPAPPSTSSSPASSDHTVAPFSRLLGILVWAGSWMDVPQPKVRSWRSGTLSHVFSSE